MAWFGWLVWVGMSGWFDWLGYKYSMRSRKSQGSQYFYSLLYHAAVRLETIVREGYVYGNGKFFFDKESLFYQTAFNAIFIKFVDNLILVIKP